MRTAATAWFGTVDLGTRVTLPQLCACMFPASCPVRQTNILEAVILRSHLGLWDMQHSQVNTKADHYVRGCVSGLCGLALGGFNGPFNHETWCVRCD